jgi:hypothetical protein
MIKSAFQIPHHVAIRIFVCAQPRRKLSQNVGAGGDGFPARPEKAPGRPPHQPIGTSGSKQV